MNSEVTEYFKIIEDEIYTELTNINSDSYSASTHIAKKIIGLMMMSKLNNSADKEQLAELESKNLIDFSLAKKMEKYYVKAIN